MLSIWHIQQFRSLAAIGKRRGVTFALRGGVAYRLALLRAEATDERLIDLFDLVRFASDIDLVHSGPAELTSALYDDILSGVDNAECFRWEICSAEEIKKFSLHSHSNIIPARAIEISDEPYDAYSGLVDIRKRNFRYLRDPRFKYSTQYKAGQDLEIFSALLFFQTLGEAKILGNAQEQQGWSAAKAVFEEAIDDLEIRQLIETHAYLRCRLRRLLVNIYALYEHRNEFHDVSDAIGLPLFIKSIADCARLSNSGLNSGEKEFSFLRICESDRLGGDTYRLKMTFEDWATTFENIPLPKMDDVQAPIAVSPLIEIARGHTTYGGGSQSAKKFEGEQIQEFVHLATHALKEPVDDIDENLSALLMISDVDGSEWSPYALPAIVSCSYVSSNRTLIYKQFFIRINSFGLLAAASQLGHKKARVVLVAWRPTQ